MKIKFIYIKNHYSDDAIMQEKSIGVAKMEKDGTLILMLRAESDSGIRGDAQFRYQKTDPDYNKILQHIGKIKPGETKNVPPWDEI